MFRIPAFPHSAFCSASRCFLSRALALMSVLSIGACGSDDRLQTPTEMASVRNQRATTAGPVPIVGYRATIRVSMSRGDEAPREAESRVEVDLRQAGKIARIETVSARGASSPIGKETREVFLNWAGAAGPTAKRADGSVSAFASPNPAFDAEHENSGHTRDYASMVSRLNQLRRLETPAQAVPLGRGDYVAFASLAELSAKQLAIEARLGPGRRIGSQIEYRGSTAAGNVTVRLNDTTYAVEYERVERSDKGIVTREDAYTLLGNGILARTRSAVTSVPRSGVPLRAVYAVQDLEVMEGVRP